MMQELALAVEELLRKAEDTDSTPLSDGRSEKAQLAPKHTLKSKPARLVNRGRVLAVMGRIRDLEKKADPPELPTAVPRTEHRTHGVVIKAGHTRYKSRQQAVDPTFDILKTALGFRSFHLRGLTGAATEWTLSSILTCTTCTVSEQT